jgi:NAD(P)-dependent dehydrogenase (short-subunit alcohol dehydrogenase family)
MALYASARGAVESLVKSSAHELASQNKRINSIRAGAVKTEMHARLTANLSQEQIEAYENEHLLGFGETKDIAEVVLFLLSERSKWITGTSIDVDGGFLA